MFVILTEASNASGRKWLLVSGQLRANEAGTGSEIAKRSFADSVAPASGILIGWSNAKPEPATLTRRCPRSFHPLALLASSG
jgi:hypothetical protein